MGYAHTVAKVSIATNSNSLHTMKMLIKETRLKNLQWLYLRARQSGANQKDFAGTVGIDPNVFNQYLTKFRNIGEKAARRIEGKLRLGEGWMDQPHTMEWEEMANGSFDGYTPRSVSPTRSGLAIAARLDALDEEEVDYVMKTLDILERAKNRATMLQAQRAIRPKKVS